MKRREFIKSVATIVAGLSMPSVLSPYFSDSEAFDVKRLDTVIVGIDQVAIDSFGATLFGMKGSDLGYVRIGASRGFGTMDLSRLRIKRINL